MPAASAMLRHDLHAYARLTGLEGESAREDSTGDGNTQTSPVSSATARARDSADELRVQRVGMPVRDLVDFGAPANDALLEVDVIPAQLTHRRRAVPRKPEQQTSSSAASDLPPWHGPSRTARPTAPAVAATPRSAWRDRGADSCPADTRQSSRARSAQFSTASNNLQSCSTSAREPPFPRGRGVRVLPSDVERCSSSNLVH